VCIGDRVHTGQSASGIECIVERVRGIKKGRERGEYWRGEYWRGGKSVDWRGEGVR